MQRGIGAAGWLDVFVGRRVGWLLAALMNGVRQWQQEGPSFPRYRRPPGIDIAPGRFNLQEAAGGGRAGSNRRAAAGPLPWHHLRRVPSYCDADGGTAINVDAERRVDPNSESPAGGRGGVATRHAVRWPGEGDLRTLAWHHPRWAACSVPLQAARSVFLPRGDLSLARIQLETSPKQTQEQDQQQCGGLL
ncbi:unnamed protein product [Lampetra planeri]